MTSQGGYFMISVILAASHEREPDQTHQGLQFTVPRGSPPAGPRGRELSADFHLLGRGLLKKLRMHNFRRKRSIVQKQKLMITAVSRHTHIYILYVYIIEGTKYWNLELLNMSHPFSWGIPPWESMSHDWYPLDVFKQSWFAWFLVPSISWHLPSLLVRSYLLIYFNTF
jgi:hypothetical protein